MKLNFRLGKIVDYAHKKVDVSVATSKFFSKKSANKLLENSMVSALFNEWLIFDYRNKLGTSIIAEYYLKNPDSLTKDQLKQLEQVVKTERYEVMEVISITRDKGLSIRIVRTGEILFVDDLAGSRSATVPSLFFNRLAKTDGKWIFVGCDNVSFPTRLSETARKHFAKILNKEKNTPKLVLDVFGDRFVNND